MLYLTILPLYLKKNTGKEVRRLFLDFFKLAIQLASPVT